MKAAALEKGGTVVIADVECAETAWERMRGLLGRSGLGSGRAMHLVCHGAVHTFFMKFPLDLVFLTREMRVSRIVRSVRPNRIAAGRGAWSVIEMEAGRLPEDALNVGDTVRLVPSPHSGAGLDGSH